jgi:lysozyme family protein
MAGTEYTDIYYRYYWTPSGGRISPSGVDYCVFDAAVNSGVRQAVKWLQRALKGQGLYAEGGIDGQFGIQTSEAVLEADPIQLIEDICNQRLWFLQKLDTWATFGKGWGRRVKDVRRISKIMAERDAKPKKEPPVEPDDPVVEQPAPPTEISADEMAKAPPSSTKTTETPAGNVAAKTGGLGIITVILSILEKGSEYIAVFTGMPQWLVQYILIALIIAAVVGIIGFAAVALVDVIRKKRKLEDVEAP